MKKFLFIFSIFFIAFSFSSCDYNNLVTLRENVDSQWANVENQYQRRADLIPNLVNTVKAYAAHEEKVFAEIAEARSKAGGLVNIDSSITEDPEKLAEFQKLQDSLGKSMQRLLVISENYPELKSNENFLDLQSQLEGTENRISTERTRYNDQARVYNTEIQKMPQVLYAKKMGFSPKAYFTASSDAQTAPVVSF